MTTEPTPQDRAALGLDRDNNDNPQVVSPIFRGDPILRVLVAAINRGVEGSMSMTLTTAAGTVAGMVVSFEGWRQGVSEWVTETGGTTAGADEVAAVFGGDALAPLAPVPSEPWTIHMANATLRSGAHQVTFPFWRGRLEEVIGWTLGDLA